MPLGFANPALLFGALASALPVIIHFLSRRKVRRVAFSDLRFLEDVRSRQSRSLGLRRWLLLLLRVLAILLITLAVAGPRWGGLATGGDGVRSLLFVVDTSASMGTQLEQGTRFDAAVAACGEMIGALPDGSHVQVLTAGAVTGPVFGEWLPAGAGTRQGLTALRQTDGAFDLAAVLTAAAREVARAPSATVELVLLSDLQQVGDPTGLDRALARLVGAGHVKVLVRPVGTATVGGGVLDVRLPARAVQQGENVSVGATVLAPEGEQVFVLEVDGRPVAETVVQGTGQVPVDIDFPLAVPAAGLHRGRVRKGSDAFPADDARPFALQVPDRIRVLLVHGADRPVDGVAGRGRWRFLAQALQPGGGPGLFRVTEVTSDALTTGDLAAAQVVVCVECDPLGRRALGGLQSWLEGGGAALFLTGDPSRQTWLAGSLLPLLGLPDTPVYRREPAANAQRPRIIDAAHPVFAGLEADALATFEEVRWQRWWQLEEGTQRVLLDLTDGSPLLIEGAVGEGRFVLLPFDLDPAGNTLVTSPMALPFFQRLTAWLAGGAGSTGAVNTQVGQRAQVAVLQDRGDTRLEQASRLLVSDDRSDQGRTADLVWYRGRPTLTGDILARAGFTTFTAGDDTVGLVAAGLPAAESGLALESAADWSSRLGARGLPVAGLIDPTAGIPFDEVLSGRSLASWFFALAALILLLELTLGRGLTPHSD